MYHTEGLHTSELCGKAHFTIIYGEFFVYKKKKTLKKIRSNHISHGVEFSEEYEIKKNKLIFYVFKYRRDYYNILYSPKTHGVVTTIIVLGAVHSHFT